MRAQGTRDRIVEVARILFIKNGFENTTMQDIANMSGNGRRTLYTHFRNKDQIYLAVIEYEMKDLAQELSKVSRLQLYPEDKLVELAFIHLHLIKDAIRRNSNLKTAYFQNIEVVEQVRQKFDKQEIGLIRSIMTEGIMMGRFEIEEIPFTAEIILCCIKGMEMPYINGTLMQGMTPRTARSILRKIIHKSFKKT